MVDDSKPLASADARVTTDPATGKRMTAVGKSMTATTRAVTVASLLADPTAYQGQTVKVEGDVIAMCSHRRAWFAISGDSSGPKSALRVITFPAFLVPQDAMGQRAVAEGVVEVKQLSEQAASHQSRDHGLPNEQKVVLLRATGAEFR